MEIGVRGYILGRTAEKIRGGRVETKIKRCAEHTLQDCFIIFPF